MADGTYVAVRDNASVTSTSPAAVLMQHLDVDGNPVGSEAMVGSGTSPTVTAFPDGSYLVTWHPSLKSEAVSSNSGVGGQRFDPAGVAVGPRMTTLGQFAPYQQATALADGGFLVTTWGNETMSRGSDGDVVGFAKDGSRTGFVATDELGSSDTCGNGFPVIASMPTGGFTLAWLHQCNGPQELRLRTHDASGHLVASSNITLTPSPTVFVAGLSVATLASGNVAVKWQVIDVTQPDLAEVHAFVMDPFNLPSSLPSTSAVPSQPGRHPQAVQSLSDGGFLVPWSALSAGEAQVPVSRYSSSGDPLPR